MVMWYLADVGLDIQDDLGRHEVGFIENTEKIPVGDGGCRFKATFKINKVLPFVWMHCCHVI